MNPYFLLLYVLTAIYKWFDLSTVIHLVMSFIKNIKLIGSMLTPDPKGTIEHLRDGILKVNYVDNNQSKYFLLPHAVPALNWTKVFAISIEQYGRGQLKRDFIEANKKETETPIDPDLLADIADAETHQGDLKVISMRPASAKPKVSLKDFERTDVTEFIESVAGPGKDFFGCPITPQQLNRDFKYLIFHFPKRTKTFTAADSLNTLGNK